MLKVNQGLKMMIPKVLISVLNWNNSTATINCVQSILKYVKLPAELYKIVIVDNASIDNSYNDISTALPTIEVIKSSENLGYSAGHFLAYDRYKNEGFELFWILNNDLIINDTTLPELIKAYQQNGCAIYGSMSVKGGNLIEFSGLQEISNYMIPEKRYDEYYGKNLKELTNPRTYWTVQVHGFSLLLPFSLLQKYGFLNQDYFMYHEETEYCLRLLRDHKIKSFIVQGSIVNHETSTSFKKSNNLKYIKEYYISRNDYLLLTRIYKYKKRSYLKQDLKDIWKIIYLLIPRKVLLKKCSDDFIRNYFKLLGRVDFYLNRLGKTVKPEDYL